MRTLLSLVVNGREVSREIDSSLTLLDFLREELELKGTKEGCGKGECGACTVLLNGAPVNSCLVAAVQAEGASVTTIEGIGTEDNLHPVQEAYITEGGVQCGFCTPGFIVSTVALLERNPNPTRDEIRKALEGNLCRCTGYEKIFRAVERAAEMMRR